MTGVPGRRLALVPLVVAAGIAVAFVGGEVAALGGDAAGPTALSAATSTVFVIAPTVAAVAAWQIGRLRRGRVDTWATARSWRAVVGAGIVDVVVAGWGALAVAIGRAVAADVSPQGGWGAAATLMVVSAAAVIVAFAALGAAAGWRLPPAAALPVCLVGGYLWLVWPIALDPVWIRHLTGFRASCCGVATELIPAAVLAPAVVAAGYTLAGAALLGPGRLRAAHAAVATLSVVAGVVFVAPLVRSLGPDPVRPRRTGLECSWVRPITGDRVDVCLWAENRDQRDATTSAVRAVAPVVARLGLPPIRKVTEAGTTSFGTSSDASRIDVLGSLVASAVTPPRFVQCVPELDGLPPDSAALDTVLIDWVVWEAADAFGGRDELVERWSPQLRRALTRLSAQAPDVQRTWFAAERAALTDCSIAPRPLPTS